MAGNLITLTTDFGEQSPYVAAMKGVILSINADARLLDLGHQIPPQDVRHTAHFLAVALPWFPPETLHVIVVDPGVGSDRAVLYVEAGGQRLLAPDNGCWTWFAKDQSVSRVLRLAEPRYWRHPVSATFHGRDIFAPVAGHLSLGLDPAGLGPPVADWVRLPVPAWRAGPSELTGEVLFVDYFGNAITSIPTEALPPEVAAVSVSSAGQNLQMPRVRTYAEAATGQLVLLASSSGMLELAVVQGNAARRLGMQPGDPVRLAWEAGTA
jgi:S-adenosylmethionine hydrolase